MPVRWHGWQTALGSKHPERWGGRLLSTTTETPVAVDTAAVIFNPASGGDDVEKRRGQLRQALESQGTPYELFETSKQERAGPLARRALSSGVRRFIVCGGDGTVVEAAEALAGTGASLAVLPGGTANLLAVNAGVPSDLGEALRLANDVEPQPYDVGRANGKAFLIVAGMGADAEAVRETDDGVKERLGPFAYVLATARNIVRPKVRYTITVDGQTLERWARTVLLVNSGQLPGRAAFAPDADPHDGQLDLVVVRARGLTDVLHVGLGMLLGRRPSHDDVEVLRCQSATIVTETAQPVQLDGNESESVSRLEASVEPGALCLVHRPQAAEGAVPEGLKLPLWIPILAVSAALVVQRKGRKGSRAVPVACVLIAGAVLAGIARRLAHRSG